MKTIPVGELRTHCPRIVDEVCSQRQTVLITENGVAVAKLVPVPHAAKRDAFGCPAGTIEILGDIEAPLVARGERERD
jgi:antitoxin (DNA-binding transcriptional repressor) of toxin-antitoxin stability system